MKNGYGILILALLGIGGFASADDNSSETRFDPSKMTAIQVPPKDNPDQYMGLPPPPIPSRNTPSGLKEVCLNGKVLLLVGYAWYTSVLWDIDEQGKPRKCDSPK